MKIALNQFLNHMLSAGISHLRDEGPWCAGLSDFSTKVSRYFFIDVSADVPSLNSKDTVIIESIYNTFVFKMLKNISKFHFSAENAQSKLVRFD